jgi:hypothetical protein
VIVVASRDDGVTLDVTGDAAVRLSDEAVARLDATRCIRSLTDQTKLVAEYQGLQAEASIAVVDATAERPISFHLDVMPVLMRAGCNSGSCHGAARGKDGFALSLFGFDPASDYQQHHPPGSHAAHQSGSARSESAGREVRRRGAAHRWKAVRCRQPYYRTLIRWIEAGVPLDEGQPPHVTQLDVYPPQAVIEGAETTQQFIARARYSDGTDRDVTDLAVFMTNNDNSAAIDADGLVTAGARGEAFVMGRFATETVGSQVLVLPADTPYTPPPLTGNYIDDFVIEKLKRLRILPSEICTDEEFLRRVTIDITGITADRRRVSCVHGRYESEQAGRVGR